MLVCMVVTRSTTLNYRIQNDYQRYGEEHTSNSLLYDMPSNLSKYEPWKYCSSAQMI